MRDVSCALRSFVNEAWFIDSSDRISVTIDWLRKQAAGEVMSLVSPVQPQSPAGGPGGELHPARASPIPSSPAALDGEAVPLPASSVLEPIVEDAVVEVDMGTAVSCHPRSCLSVLLTRI